MIEVKNLTKKYGGHTVVNHLNFTIQPGKIYGFLGPNGAGKSTTMNMITGCLAMTEGQVLIDGHDIYEDAAEVKKYIGYLPEIPPVYPDMTPEEYLRFVAEAKGIRSSEIYEQIYRAMDETGLVERKDRLIKNLSKGFRQRVGIAQAMLGDPKLIILDEPTVGLDPRQILEIRDLILELGKTRTIILSSHILSEVSAVCDHVMIINQGNLVASDTLENIRKNNMPDDRVEMTVRANPESIDEILRSVDGIVSYALDKSPDDENLYDIDIEVETGADVCEKLFSAFAERHFSVKKLAKTELSLEEIFLKLTEAPASDGDGEDADDEALTDSALRFAADNGEDCDDEEDDEEDGEDYVPLFSAKKKDDGEDNE